MLRDWCRLRFSLMIPGAKACGINIFVKCLKACAKKLKRPKKRPRAVTKNKQQQQQQQQQQTSFHDKHFSPCLSLSLPIFSLSPNSQSLD
jgi:hypothetical protein